MYHLAKLVVKDFVGFGKKEREGEKKHRRSDL
jgi:hypothetical protein